MRGLAFDMMLGMTSPGATMLVGMGLLGASLLWSCSLDKSPAGNAATQSPTTQLRDASVDADAFGPQSQADDAGADSLPGPELGSDSGPARDEACGDGILDPSETCDEGDRNGTPGHCATSCARLVEQLVIRGPEAQTRVSTPTFFDWEIDGANPDIKYCNVLMTDRLGTPEDRMGEQAFYTGTDTELIATLNARRYRGGTFSFDVITVACEDRAADCRQFDCYSGSLCPLPCAGRTIVSETRALRGIEP